MYHPLGGGRRHSGRENPIALGDDDCAILMTANGQILMAAHTLRCEVIVRNEHA